MSGVLFDGLRQEERWQARAPEDRTKEGYIPTILPGEMHLPNGRMRQQLLPIPPEQFLPHLRLELDLHRLEVLQPPLRRNKWIIRAEQEAILQTSGRLAQ